jgi:DNA-binding response OmpR family regulator
MQGKKILIADDESRIREMVREYAEAEGALCEEAADGREAIDRAAEKEYDAIVLDIMMPRVDGWVACREIRSHSRVPIIMLSARGEEYDKLFGFELGVDDYLTKPFSPKELMARLKAIIRRSAGEQKDVASFGSMQIDYAAKVVTIDGERIPLAPREFELLAFLSRNPGIAFSREKLLSSVWGYDYYGEDRTVDTHIKAVRNAIKQYRACIVTVWGTGYRFEYDPAKIN